jgi:dipeptidyl-peptidase-4
MKRILSLIMVGFLSSIILLPAQTKTINLEEAVLGRADLSPDNIRSLDWIPGTSKFGYVKQVAEEWTLLAGEAAKTNREKLATLEELNAALKAAGGKELSSFPGIRFISATSFRFSSSNTLYAYDWAAKKVTTLNSWSEDAANVDLNPQHGIAYTIDNNLYVSMPGQKDEAVTREKNQNIRNGEAAHRFEFGITKGTFWSHDGKLLAFYRVDESMVTDYPLFNLHKIPATPEVIKYPFAGAASHHASLGIYNPEQKTTVWCKVEGDPEHYLTNVTFNPDGTEIYIAELTRGQDAMKLNRYSARTGEYLGYVLSESDPKYVEPKHGPIFLPGKNDEFLWFSMRDGHDHLYHYKTDGTLLGQVTKGNFMVTDFLGFDEDGKNCFVSTTAANPTERHTYLVNLKKYSSTLLTPGAGSHSSTIHPTGKYLIDSWSSIEVPRDISIRDNKGAEIQSLLKAPNPLQDYKIAYPKLFTIKSADKTTDLWCRMFSPTDLDPTKKYPVLVYVYNGPGVQLVRNTWMAAAPLWMSWMADQGYIVFTVDGRGSANVGRDFEQAIFQELGTVEITDQLAGIDYLKSLPYVDPDRLVVHGWSYGGFMTCNLMLRTPGTFNAGVAGGPVIGWDMYEVMYTERYMDTPQTNREGYKNSLLTNYVKGLKGKLMLIHGTNDDVVVWQHSLRFLEACIDEGVQVDYFVYPSHAHNVRGKDRLHLMTKVLNYLMDNNH